jgi:hypothetical protein
MHDTPPLGYPLLSALSIENHPGLRKIDKYKSEKHPVL